MEEMMCYIPENLEEALAIMDENQQSNPSIKNQFVVRNECNTAFHKEQPADALSLRLDLNKKWHFHRTQLL